MIERREWVRGPTAPDGVAMGEPAGLGLLITAEVVRAVAVDDRGGTTLVGEEPVLDGGEGRALTRALRSLRPVASLPLRVAIDDRSATITTTPLDGLGARGVAEVLRTAADRGADLVTVVGGRGLVVTWDVERAERIAELVAGLGFTVGATEPAEVACARADEPDAARAAARAAAGQVPTPPLRRLTRRPTAVDHVWVIQRLPDPPAPEPDDPPRGVSSRLGRLLGRWARRCSPPHAADGHHPPLGEDDQPERPTIRPLRRIRGPRRAGVGRGLVL